MFKDLSTTHLAMKDEDRMIIVNSYEQLIALLSDFSITEPRKKLILLQLPNLTEEENISFGEALNRQYHAYGYKEAMIAGIAGALISVPLSLTGLIFHAESDITWNIFFSILMVIASAIAGKLYGLGNAKQKLYRTILDLKYKNRSRQETPVKVATKKEPVTII